MKKTWIGIIIGVAVVLAAVFIFTQTVTESEKIKIGAILPLSGSGAKYGEEAKNGINLAVMQINTSGGVNNKEIKIIYEDDQGKSSGAINAFNKLVTVNKVPVVIGPMYSSTVLSVAPIAEEKKVVLFTPSGSSPEITQAGDYVFRNWPSDTFEGSEMANFAYEQLDLQKAAILTVNIDYGTGLTEVFKNKFTALGGQVLAIEKYDQGDTDFRSQLTKIKATKPDVLYLPGYYTEIALILKLAKELGFDTKYLSCVGFDNPKAIELAGEAAEDVIFARPAYDPNSEDEVVSGFVESFKGEYNTIPGTYAAHAYDALNILIIAIKRGGYEAEDIKDVLYNVQNFNGVTGSTSFDKNGDVIKSIQIMTVRKGHFVKVHE